MQAALETLLVYTRYNLVKLRRTHRIENLAMVEALNELQGIKMLDFNVDELLFRADEDHVRNVIPLIDTILSFTEAQEADSRKQKDTQQKKDIMFMNRDPKHFPAILYGEAHPGLGAPGGDARRESVYYLLDHKMPVFYTGAQIWQVVVNALTDIFPSPGPNGHGHQFAMPNLGPWVAPSWDRPTPQTRTTCTGRPRMGSQRPPGSTQNG